MEQMAWKRMKGLTMRARTEIAMEMAGRGDINRGAISLFKAIRERTQDSKSLTTMMTEFLNTFAGDGNMWDDTYVSCVQASDTCCIFLMMITFCFLLEALLLISESLTM